MKKIILVAGVVIAGGVLAGVFIGGWHNTPQSKSASRVSNIAQPVLSTDACGILPAAEVSRVLKQPMKQIDHTSNAAKPGVVILGTSCVYGSTAAHAKFTLVTCTISYAGDDPAKIALNKDNFAASRTESDITVPGLGDDAFFVPQPTVYNLHVLKGAYHVIIDVGDDQQPFPDQAADVALAKAALVRLK